MHETAAVNETRRARQLRAAADEARRAAEWLDQAADSVRDYDTREADHHLATARNLIKLSRQP